MPNVNRRLSLLTVIMIVAAAFVAGCGVPWSSGVITDRSANNSGSGTDKPIEDPPPGPDGITGAQAFVDAYLGALAGRSESDQQSLRKAATAFMSDSLASQWKAGEGIRVVRPLSGGQISSYLTGGYEYNVDVQVVGVFSPTDGTLRPPAKKTVFHLNLKMGPVLNDQGTQQQRLQFVTEMPDGMLLSEQALNKYYRAQSVYFYDPAKQVMISEIRYAPLTVKRLQRATMIVNWVLGGPTDVLGTAAARIVNATLLDPVVTEVDGKVVVDLAQTRNLEAADALKLTDELRWSLYSADFGTLPVISLQVERQNQSAIDRSIADDANPISFNNEPTGFAISKGHVRALDGGQLPTLLRDLPAQNSPNSNVVSAAVTSESRPGIAVAALVRRINGQDQLFIRSGTGPFKKVLAGSSLGRPTMIAKPHPMVALIVDGKFTLVDVGTRVHNQTVAVPGSGALTSLSVAPDDRRLAIVNTSGQLFTSNLIWQSGAVTATQAWPVWPDVSKVTSVAWSAAGEVVVSGYQADSKDYVLMEINSDGTRSKELDHSTSPIDHVAAFPYNPIDSLSKNAVMYDTSGGARQVSSRTDPQAVSWGDPSGSDLGTPVAPFFAD